MPRYIFAPLKEFFLCMSQVKINRMSILTSLKLIVSETFRLPNVKFNCKSNWLLIGVGDGFDRKIHKTYAQGYLVTFHKMMFQKIFLVNIG